MQLILQLMCIEDLLEIFFRNFNEWLIYVIYAKKNHESRGVVKWRVYIYCAIQSNYLLQRMKRTLIQGYARPFGEVFGVQIIFPSFKL